MSKLSEPNPSNATRSKGRVDRFVEDLVVDILITAAIVWGLVLVGEPLIDVFTSPLFIILTAAGLIHLVHKTLRHGATATDD